MSSKPKEKNMLNMKNLPAEDYRKEVVQRDDGRYETRFVCRFDNCNKVFNKSSSLTVHYMRH